MCFQMATALSLGFVTLITLTHTLFVHKLQTPLKYRHISKQEISSQKLTAMDIPRLLYFSATKRADGKQQIIQM